MSPTLLDDVSFGSLLNGLLGELLSQLVAQINDLSLKGSKATRKSPSRTDLATHEDEDSSSRQTLVYLADLQC